MRQLESTFGPISMDDMVIDPALGPPPWTSFVPDRDPSTVLAWNALAERVSEAEATAALKAAPERVEQAQALGQIVAQDIEGPQEQGLNDTVATGQFIPGFGTGAGDQPFARIVGNLMGQGSTIPVPPPPPPPLECPSVEEDGSILDATPTLLNIDGIPTQFCGGFIGDGEFGTTTGDVDFFALNEVAADSLIVLDAGTFDDSPFSLTLAIYSADGVLLASHDDDSTDEDDLLEFVAPTTGNYFAAVAGVGTLPSDPFDPSSGGGVSYVGEWLVLALAVPPPDSSPAPGPPPPLLPPGPPLPANLWSTGFAALDAACESVEDDGAIPLANLVAVELDEAVQCFGVIGDGPFGATSGDFDFYTVFANEGDTVVAVTQAQAIGSPLDTFLVAFDDFGVPVATNDDFNGLDSQIFFAAPFTGNFHVGVLLADSLPADPFISASGSGVTATGPYSLTLARIAPPPPPPAGDTDVYLVDLEVGDVISGEFAAAGVTAIVEPAGRLGQGSTLSFSVDYPLTNPLRHLGQVGIDFVAEFAGLHAIVVEVGDGFYEGELRVQRAGATDLPGDDAQTLFLDFDGGSFSTDSFVSLTFGGLLDPNAAPQRSLSPLTSALPGWGLDASDEEAVIEAIVAQVTDDLLRDLQAAGINGNRDVTGNGGELDLRILNSRDHDDPFGQPNVSRVIIGGSRAEANFDAVGLAQTVDPGNFETEETAIVLLDQLSAPANQNSFSVNRIPVAAPFTMVDLVGRALGKAAAHEAGHLLGGWHTTGANNVHNLMDEASNIQALVGVGPDGVFGTDDDQAVDFVTDEYSRVEFRSGFQNTALRVAQALSTGQTNVVPFVEGLPEEGNYVLRNVRSGQFLDADGNGAVNTSILANPDDVWEITNIGRDIFNLRNEVFRGFLDGDADNVVDQSDSARNDDRWRLIPTNAGSFFLYNTVRDRFLGQIGREVRLTSDQTAAERWFFDTPEMSSPLVDQRIALQSGLTGRFLDIDPNGDVNQSLNLRSDDMWDVLDAGDGYVFLQNAASGRFLDGDAAYANVDSSQFARSDDRWLIMDDEASACDAAEAAVSGCTPHLLIMNVDSGGVLVAQERDQRFNVVTEPTPSGGAVWNMVAGS